MEFISRLRRNGVRLSVMMLLLGMMGVGLVACGGADATATPAATGGSGGSNTGSAVTPAAQGGASSGGGQEVQAVLKEWSVALNVDQVNAGKVKFMVSNAGQYGHDMSVLDSSGAAIGTTPVFKSADGTKELDVDLKPGIYTLVCDVPGHTAKGMTTKLTVK